MLFLPQISTLFRTNIFWHFLKSYLCVINTTNIITKLYLKSKCFLVFFLVFLIHVEYNSKCTFIKNFSKSMIKCTIFLLFSYFLYYFLLKNGIIILYSIKLLLFLSMANSKNTLIFFKNQKLNALLLC